VAKQTVNIGTSANARNGDPLRIAFDKINDNFDELYTALGLDEAPLNLGAFEFTGSTLTTTDSSAIVIDQATTITSNLTVGGDIFPNVNEEYSLGSSTKRFKDIYLSGSTIDLGGTTLSIVGGNLQIGGTDIKDVVTAAGVDYSEIQNTPNLSNYIQQGDRLDGDLEGSVFADDSTLLVDGVNGTIPYSVISDVQVTESDLLVDFAPIVASQIQANGLPNNTRFSQGAPATSIGIDGDLQGAVTFDSSYIYYCTDDYDGVTNIWKRVAWSGDTWT